MNHSRTLILLTLSISFFLAGVGAAWYMLDAIDTLENGLIDKRAEIKKEDDKQQMILDVKKQLKRLEVQRSEIDQYFVKEEDVVHLIEQLENLAKHAGVELDVTTATGVGSGEGAVFQIGMKTQGTWQNCMYFLAMIETLPVHLTINHVTFQGSEDGKTWVNEIALSILSFTPTATIKN